MLLFLCHPYKNTECLGLVRRHAKYVYWVEGNPQKNRNIEKKRAAAITGYKMLSRIKRADSLPPVFASLFSSVASRRVWKNIYKRDRHGVHIGYVHVCYPKNNLFLFFSVYIVVSSSIELSYTNKIIEPFSNIFGTTGMDITFSFFDFYHIITSMVGHCYTKLFHRPSFDTYRHT